MILESLTRTTVFSCDDLAITRFSEQHQRIVQDYLDPFYYLSLNKLSLMEENGGGVSEILINVLEILPGSNRRHIGFEDLVKMNCTRCKMDTEYPPQPSFDYVFFFLLLSQSAFEDFTFERILKAIRINSMTSCKTKDWENNETEEEILATISVLATEIDISKIYKYEGGSPQTKYNLVSMFAVEKKINASCSICDLAIVQSQLST
ncbi:hypothetical protein Bca52824_024090 [Brassica carinata]|uniref:Uncharacterized protein n=1 Tax=Brassica carinata TaxID=52824 RepID=A0A8X8AVC8_BRACI|nr:hypothetical protein Bca52824_024090 [Brassica carinata]